VLRVKDEPPVVEILDELTVRYTWSQPNPSFLPALAGARPLFIYRPAHYLKQFHAKYTPAESLEPMVKKSGTRNWAGLHHRKDHPYKSDNPDLPVLQPWKDVTPPPAERFIFERNPFYHRVDTNGRQLPYIDRVVVNISANKLVPAKTGAGDADLQARYLRFDNYTFLKAGEKRNDYQVRLWRTARGSQIALYPNLNVTDPAWRELIRDVRFRRALSIAIDRQEINQVVYYGLAVEAANTVLPESPLFRESYQKAWVDFDLDEANRLLDEVGLTERNSRGLRLLPDGRPMELIIETAGESTEETDVLELIHDSWVKIGIKPFAKPSQREVFRNRIFSGDAVMSIWSGLDNGIPTPDMAPAEFAPTSQVHLQWPQWGQHFETGGEAGGPPDLPDAQRLLALYVAWEQAASGEQREAIWHEMLSLFADQVYSIGVVSGVRQPVVVSDDLNNVPDEGIYSWDPGAYFGIYHPDTFWFGPERR
jgi:peptide/nickel transport system substrate-binding protein